ncbi:MAG: RluA family pseudouridine synthase [Clostridia bacterium]|nr:RluA family pseudouridine synthase [Clostridia bacterium]
MRILTLTIPTEYDGVQIKSVLRKHFGLSSALITALKTADGITLNGVHANVTEKAHTGDTLVLRIYETDSENIVATEMELDILYEDEDILAVNKPAGIPTHPSIRHYSDTLANGVRYYYKDLPFTFRAVNRLDKDTSGIVLIAKNRFSSEALSKQIREKKIGKAYLAICCGALPAKDGIVNVPIARDEGIIKRRIDEAGQYAETHYSVLAQAEAYTLVQAEPITGRTHQIRVHMAHLGAPLYADFLYGKEVPGSRTMLHCSTLTFLHPLTKKKMRLSAPPSPDFELLKQKLFQ